MIGDRLYDCSIPESAFRYNELDLFADQFIQAVMSKTNKPFYLLLEAHPNHLLNLHGDRLLVAREAVSMDLDIKKWIKYDPSH
jgi:hypothetical protein